MYKGLRQEDRKVIGTVSYLRFDIEDVGCPYFIFPFGVSALAVGNPGIPILEGLRIPISQILVGIGVITPYCQGFPNQCIDLDGRRIGHKLRLPTSLIIIGDAIPVAKGNIWRYLVVRSDARGIGLGKAFIYGLLSLYELIDLAVIQTRIKAGPDFPESTLNTPKNGGGFIRKTGIEKGAGPNDIVKIGQAPNLIDITRVGGPCKNVGIVK